MTKKTYQIDKGNKARCDFYESLEKNGFESVVDYGTSRCGLAGVFHVLDTTVTLDNLNNVDIIATDEDKIRLAKSKLESITDCKLKEIK